MGRPPPWLRRISRFAIFLFIPFYIFQVVGFPVIHIGYVFVYAGGDGLMDLLWGGVHYHEADVYLMPINICLLVMALIPLVYKIRLTRPYPDGHCQICGYDLRATPDRCPECGKVVQKTG